jgi:DNA-binding MarR family transcriptional regulator
MADGSTAIVGRQNLRRGYDSELSQMAVDFQDTVIALRRVARRAARKNLPELPSSESELLSLVEELKGIGVSEAARLMQVSPNTVSTLIRSLTRRGLLERLSDPSDRRAALLHVTGAGAARIRRIRRQRADAITKAMLALKEADRKTLANAVPAMRRLLGELELGDPARAADRPAPGEARARARI